MKRRTRAIRARKESKNGQGPATIEQGSAQAEEGEGEDQRVAAVAEGRLGRACEEGLSASERWRAALRWLLALSYVAAGAIHLSLPRPFIAITPDWVPMKPTVIALTGVAEIAGATALAQPWSGRLRRAGGIGLALYAVCVLPANINHMLIDMARPHPQLGLAYHIPRLLLQPVLVWAALWVSARPARR